MGPTTTASARHCTSCNKCRREFEVRREKWRFWSAASHNQCTSSPGPLSELRRPSLPSLRRGCADALRLVFLRIVLVAIVAHAANLRAHPLETRAPRSAPRSGMHRKPSHFLRRKAYMLSILFRRAARCRYVASAEEARRARSCVRHPRSDAGARMSALVTGSVSLHQFQCLTA